MKMKSNFGARNSMKMWAYLKRALLILMQGLRNLRVRRLKPRRKKDHAAEIRVRKYGEEMRFEKGKLEQRLKYEKQVEDSRKDQNKQDKSINAKLPKLVITKFKGTHTNWLQFWNQFKAEMDLSDVSPITKFSYLKELVDPKVRSTIDALPFKVLRRLFASKKYSNNQVWKGKRNHQCTCH